MEVFLNPDAWIALLTLTFLEIILGIDNIIFISILAGKLPAEQQAKARRVGLMLAMVTRIPGSSRAYNGSISIGWFTA